VLDPTSEFAVIEGSHAVAVPIAGMVQGIRQIESSRIVSERLPHRIMILDAHVRQGQHVVQDGADFSRGKAIVVGCRSDFDRYFRVPYGGQEEEFLWPTNTWLT
jgi:hypothetical protein